jgi:hypothetical protein
MRCAVWLIGFTTPARTVDFSSRVRSLSRRRPSETFERLEFNCPLSHSPSEFLRLRASTRRPRRDIESHLLRFLTLFATSRARVHMSAKVPKPPHTFRPQVFATSRRFSPQSRFAGLFHPAATSRASPVQGLLLLRSHPSSSEGACPLAVVLDVLIAEAMSARRALDFEAFIHARVRCYELRLFISTRARCPLQVFLLQVSFPVVQPFYSVAPLMMLQAPLSLSRSPRLLICSV